MNQTALALMAHPDDAEIFCGGTLIRLADAGWDIHIATLTAGDCGTMTESPEAISATRRQEATSAVAMIGGTYHCLEERDGLVCYNEQALRKAYDLFRIIAPSLVFTHAEKDYMIDHEMTSLIARSASFVHGAPNISPLPLKEGTQVPWLYYCDPIEGIDPYGQPVEPTTLIDISEVLDRKTAMLAEHASQREWLRSHHGTDEYIEAMQRHAFDRGQLIEVKSAEGFRQHLGHAYPREDRLEELFAGGWPKPMAKSGL